MFFIIYYLYFFFVLFLPPQWKSLRRWGVWSEATSCSSRFKGNTSLPLFGLMRLLTYRKKCTTGWSHATRDVLFLFLCLLSSRFWSFSSRAGLLLPWWTQWLIVICTWCWSLVWCIWRFRLCSYSPWWALYSRRHYFYFVFGNFSYVIFI